MTTSPASQSNELGSAARAGTKAAAPTARSSPKGVVAAGHPVPKATSGSATAPKAGPRTLSRAPGRHKVRRTLTLDPDLVEAFGGVEGGLSAAVNHALREHLARAKRRLALAARIAELEAEFGPPDPAEVERFARHIR